MQRLLAVPVMASQETQDLFGKLTADVDNTGLVDIDDGSTDKPYQDIANIDQTIKADANTAVPLRGEDTANVRKLSDEYYTWADDLVGDGYKPEKIDRIRNIYAQDGMPSNGESFTQGDEFPTSPADGDFHRLTYTTIGTNIPARLHKYSSVSKRWVFLERDRRDEVGDTHPELQHQKDADSTKTPQNELDAEFKKV